MTTRKEIVDETALICLKLLGIYEKIAPDDGMPFRLVAAVVAGEKPPDDARSDVERRLRALQKLADDLGVKRGLVVAARYAIDACLSLLDVADDTNLTPSAQGARARLKLANEAMSEVR